MPRKPASAKSEAAKRDVPTRKAAKEAEKATKAVLTPAPPAPKEKPAKAPKAKKPKVKVARRYKPTYAKMIVKALDELAEGRSGSSAPAILKYLKDKYPVPENYARFVRQALRAGVEDGVFGKVRASYRVTSKGRKQLGGQRKVKKSRKTSKKEGSSTTKKRATSKSPRSTKKEGEKKKRSSKKTAATTTSSSSSTTTSTAVAAAAAPLKRQKSAAKETSVKEKSHGSIETADVDGAWVPESKFDHVWQYKDGNWRNYDPKASDVVEQVYRNYLENRGDNDVRAVKSGQWEYMVDFMAFKQTNIQHENHTVRDIRRVKNNAHAAKN